MTNGFEKLERLFTGSRKKARGDQKTTTQRKTSVPSTRSHGSSSPLFPSPPYLRPTSTHMTPRNAQVEDHERTKGRSQSVPTLQEALDKRSSISSSSTVVSRPSRSNASAPPLRRTSRHSHVSPRSVRFRFPEDSLFRSYGPKRTSADSGKEDVSQEQSPRSLAAEPQGLLDWSPKHLSLLFNPLEFKAPPRVSSRRLKNDGTEPTLLPSPDFPSLELPSENHESIGTPNREGLPSPSISPRSSVQKLTLDLREQSPSFHEKPTPDSPAPSIAHKRRPSINRFMSLRNIGPSDRSTIRTTPVSLSIFPVTTDNYCRSKRNARRTWGNRLEDSQSLRGLLSGDSKVIPRPTLRKSASTSTLSILTPQVSIDRVLAEPTFDDFFALSDDDIAEGRPPTPAPMTPLSDIPHDKNYLPPSQQQLAFQHKQEELTPPDTPTDCQLLTFNYSPTKYKDTFGALWAAILANKYDFTVLYVLSLWPVGDSIDHLNHSDTTPVSEPDTAQATSRNKLVSSTKRPKISGRLLAAYGLSEVPSPFEIATDTHLAALDCDRWNEYRNIDAGPNDISRGWIRPFYIDGSPVPVATKVKGSRAKDYFKNRGIVFAAYSKHTSTPFIPMKASPEQDLLLQQLYTDAKSLVDALVRQPSHIAKAALLY
ncbi:hypothetical protein F4808DRAFT_476297 [Astrocystis sublimbata]|nr:hypothetical protein F4808DRAFT_476297 [Astrocystis sublimbata]